MGWKLCRRCGKKPRIAGMGNTYCVECKLLCGRCEIRPRALRKKKGTYCKECANHAGKLSNRKLKVRVIEMYGGACVCCGYTLVEFLTLDHITPLAESGEKVPIGNRYYHIAEKGYDNNLQVLCYNCNLGKKTGCECPHKNYKVVEYMI